MCIGFSSPSGIFGMSGTSGFSGRSTRMSQSEYENKFNVKPDYEDSSFAYYKVVHDNQIDKYSKLDGSWSRVDRMPSVDIPSGMSGFSGSSGMSGFHGLGGFSGTSGHIGIFGMSGRPGISGHIEKFDNSDFVRVSGIGRPYIPGMSGYSGIGLDLSSNVSEPLRENIANKPISQDTEVWVKDRLKTLLKMAKSIESNCKVSADDRLKDGALDGLINGCAVELIYLIGREPSFINLRKV